MGIHVCHDLLGVDTAARMKVVAFLAGEPPPASLDPNDSTVWYGPSACACGPTSDVLGVYSGLHVFLATLAK